MELWKGVVFESACVFLCVFVCFRGGMLVLEMEVVWFLYLLKSGVQFSRPAYELCRSNFVSVWYYSVTQNSNSNSSELPFL